MTTGQKAIELARAGAQTQSVREMEQRLELYRDRRAYREATDVMKLSPTN